MALRQSCRAPSFIWISCRCLIAATVIIIIALLKPSWAYSSGAPSNRKVCTGLVPGHGTKQNTPSPYKLTLVSSNNQQEVELDLVATLQVTYAGFIVQARNANDHNHIIDGYFTQFSNDTHAKSCLTTLPNTWTHENGQPKTKVSTRWSPVAGFTGGIIFQATVVQVKQAYWDQIKSTPIYFVDGKITNEMDYAKQSKLLQGKNSDPSSSSSSGNGLDYDQCESKLCIGLGEQNDCLSQKSCLAVLTVSQADDGDEQEFDIYAVPGDIGGGNEDLKSKYYSMAFSEDDSMGDDLVIDCYVDSTGNKVMVGLSRNNGKRNELYADDDDDVRTVLRQATTEMRDGMAHCHWKLSNRFSIPSLGTNKKIEYDLKMKNYFLFMATGDLENDQGYKKYHDLKVRSSMPVDLTMIGALQNKDLNFLIRIHGSLMLIAWFGFVPVAIILARYFKNAWPHRLLCGVKPWFAFHRGLMVFSICMMIIAQISIFYYLGEYRIGLHQILGSVAFVIALLQPIGAVFRPHPESRKRWIFNWMHWLGGTVAHITAAAAILLASKLRLAALPDSFLYVAIVWVLCHVVLHLILQFYSCCTSSNSKSVDIAMQDMHQRHLYSDSEPSYSGSGGNGFRYFLLTFYLILISFLVVILVIFVTAPDITKDFL